MVSKHLYERYFAALLAGNRVDCAFIVQDLLDQGIDIKDLYRDLFQVSLYQIGDLWELNRLSVAKEHLATATTESLLNLVYPFLFKKRNTSKKAIISCVANEYHQIGGKMVADILEMNGWDSYFVGANTPSDQLVEFIDEIKPDLVGLSLSVYFNLPHLLHCIEMIRHSFSGLDIIVGGQAFSWGELPSLETYKRVTYIGSLDALEAETWDKRDGINHEKHPI